VGGKIGQRADRITFRVEKPAIADLEPGDRDGAGFICKVRELREIGDFFGGRHLVLGGNSRLPICGNACRRPIAPLLLLSLSSGKNLLQTPENQLHIKKTITYVLRAKPTAGE